MCIVYCFDVLCTDDMCIHALYDMVGCVLMKCIVYSTDGQAVCTGDSGGSLYRVAICPDEEGKPCWQLQAHANKVQ